MQINQSERFPRALCRTLPDAILGIALLLGLAATPAIAQVSPQQRTALLALYDSTDGEEWHNNQGWNEAPGNECDWFGVICQFGQVVAINLPSNNLDGALPEALASLHSLRFLVLRNNHISGGVPEWLGHMPDLRYLDLSQNRLGGTLPASLLNSPSLVDIWIKDSELEGAIPEVEFPQSMLRSLILDGNELSGNLPASIANLNALTHLWLNNNRIAGDLPESLGSLTQLVEFSLRNNQWSGNPVTRTLPASLGALPALRYLDAHNSHISLNLSDWLHDATQLAEKDAFPELVHLDLGFNPLSGPFPDHFSAMPFLSVLQLQNTNLSGPLPDAGLLPARIDDTSGSFAIRIDLRDNSLLEGSLHESLLRAFFMGRALFLLDDSGLDFGSCMAWRQVSSVDNQSGLIPGDSVTVGIYTHPTAIDGTGRIFETVPEGWEAIPRPGCYCVEGSPPVVRSGLTSLFNRVYFEYTLDSPTDADLLLGNIFNGNIVRAGDTKPSGLVCGESRGWVDSIFLDRFSGAL